MVEEDRRRHGRLRCYEDEYSRQRLCWADIIITVRASAFSLCKYGMMQPRYIIDVQMPLPQ